MKTIDVLEIKDEGFTTFQVSSKYLIALARDYLETHPHMYFCSSYTPSSGWEVVLKDDASEDVLLEIKGRAALHYAEITAYSKLAGKSLGSPTYKVVDLTEALISLQAYYPSIYFKLAYTRRTDWMVWVCSESSLANLDREVLISSQESTLELVLKKAYQDLVSGGFCRE